MSPSPAAEKAHVRMALTALAAVWSVAPAAVAEPTEGPLLIRGATANRTHVAFAAAGRLWRVPLAGGVAEALTDGSAGEDLFPHYSPDGARLAFTREGGGGEDVWVMPAAGGEAKRLTFHPKDDRVRGWSPDGTAILFITGRDGDGLWRLYSIGRRGVFPRPLPLPEGVWGAHSPDGARLAYVPYSFGTELSHYHHYRGGMTSPLWIADLADSRVEVAAGPEANHRFPMWIGDTIYCLSDRTGTYNLWAYETAAGAWRRLTDFTGYGIRHASAAAGRIAFVRDGRIHLFDPATGEVRRVPVRIEPLRDELAPKTVEAAPWVTSAVLAAAGDRVLLGARGDVVLFDPGRSRGRNLTATSDVAERDPVFSPGGRRVAYFSDRSGEYRLVVRDLGGTAPERVIDVEEHPSFYRQPVWSPDGRRIAFTGKRLGLWLADLETGAARRIDRSDYLAQELYHPSWSPDGRYLAYAKGFPDHLRAVFVYDTATGEGHRVSGAVHAERPVFDAGGRYLHYLASHLAPLAAGTEIWGQLSAEMLAPLVTRTVHTVLLREGEPAPVLPVVGRPNPAARPREAAAGADIDFAGIEGRTVALPVPEKDYFELAAGGPGVLYLRHRKWPEAPGSSAEVLTPLSRFVLGEEKGFSEVVDDVDDFTVSADGGTLLYARGDELLLSRAGEEEPAELDLSGVRLEVDPGAEWRQIYREAWRLMRDYFYDPDHHGRDLPALAEHYAAYLPNVTRRRDLNALLREMLGHVSISHMSIRGGDLPEGGAESERTGVLAAELAIDRGRYRFTRVYRSGPAHATHPLVRGAPLDQPGVEVAEGEYLLAVGGEEVDASRNLYHHFAGTAYRPTVIRVGPHPDGSDARELTVMPVGGANTIKRYNWYEENRRRVEELSGGRLAYIAAPNYGFGAIVEFFRQLAVGAGREGLVIDQRYGPGGVTSDTLVQMLTAAPLHRYAFPYGADLTVPTTLVTGPRVLLVNHRNTSASETFPLMFKLAGAGTIVGTRTAGAGTGGALDYPELIDGGRITIPNRASYDPVTGRWAENDGVHPDVEVHWWPDEWRAGRDPQLEAAVEIALEQLARNPPPEVRRPAYPVHPQ